LLERAVDGCNLLIYSLINKYMNNINSKDIVIRRSSVDSLPKYKNLYNICFPKAAHLSSAYLQWLYQDNPSGEFVGADAYSGSEIIGQVAAIPGKYFFNGRYVRGLLAVNVAVHPKFQGRFLFKKLGLRMCEFGAEEGYEFVIGVANAAATPGWTRQMGFQLVQPLEARLGIGNLNINLVAAAELGQLKRTWSDKNLAWRSANPNNPIFSFSTGDRLRCYAAAKGNYLPVYSELPMQDHSHVEIKNPHFLSPFRLFLGLVPNGACKFRGYMTIPQRFRPSPLNFIYRSLTKQVPKLDKDHINFSFLDFDAY